jgi:hypothetical protein
VARAHTSLGLLAQNFLRSCACPGIVFLDNAKRGFPQCCFGYGSGPDHGVDTLARFSETAEREQRLVALQCNWERALLIGRGIIQELERRLRASTQQEQLGKFGAGSEKSGVSSGLRHLCQKVEGFRGIASQVQNTSRSACASVNFSEDR